MNRSMESDDDYKLRLRKKTAIALEKEEANLRSILQASYNQ